MTITDRCCCQKNNGIVWESNPRQVWVLGEITNMSGKVTWVKRTNQNYKAPYATVEGRKNRKRFRQEQATCGTRLEHFFQDQSRNSGVPDGVS